MRRGTSAMAVQKAEGVVMGGPGTICPASCGWAERVMMVARGSVMSGRSWLAG